MLKEMDRGRVRGAAVIKKWCSKRKKIMYVKKEEIRGKLHIIYDICKQLI